MARCHLLSRPKLIKELNDALMRRLLLVCAPAGFGKTTLCAQWRELTQGRAAKVGWLTLSELERDTDRFLYVLLLALQSAELKSDRLDRLVERGIADADQEFALAALVQVVAEAQEPLVVVLDDYHCAQCPPFDRLIRQIISVAPDNLHLIIASRERPDIDIPRLLALGQALELSTDDLRFSEEETLAVIDPSARQDIRRVIVERMEGWPVAVQLANVVLRSGGSEAFVSNFRGPARHIADYLSAHVLASLSNDLADFLVRVSFLERFNADLARASLEIDDVQNLFAMLAPLDALVVPMDGQGWFRFHRLISEYLQERLSELHPKEVPLLHKRAAHWFADQGYLIEAVRHARLAGDTPYCAQLIEQAGGWELAYSGGLGALSNLLSGFPERELDKFPRLVVAKAYLCLKAGQLERARSLISCARAELGDAPEGTQPELERDIFNVAGLLGMYEDRPYSAAEFADLQYRISTRYERDPMTTGTMQCVRAAAAIALGQLKDAQEAAREGMRGMRRAGSAVGLNYTYFHLGIALLYSGNLHSAQEHFRTARALAEENFGADSDPRDLFEILLMAIAYWRNTLSVSQYETFLEAFDRIERFDAICEIYAIASELDFEVRLHRRDRAGAQLAVHRIQRIADVRGLQRLQAIARAYELRYYLEFDEPAEAADAAIRLSKAFRFGVWREAPFEWLPYVHVATALCEYLAARDNAKATQIALDLIECCRNFGANLYLIKARLILASLRDRAGARGEAVGMVLEAGRLASGQQIRAMFTRGARIQSLMRAVLQKATRTDADALTDLLSTNAHERADAVAESDAVLTARELDVAAELAQGRSNKEIARILAMSEHTVKFHLKRIFAKLDVKSRSEAALAVRQRDIIAPRYSSG